MKHANEHLDTFVRLVADAVAAEITRTLANRVAFYTSDAPPPGMKKRTFHRRCNRATWEGARRAGRGWVLPVDDYRRWLDAQPPCRPQRLDRPRSNDVDYLASVPRRRGTL